MARFTRLWRAWEDIAGRTFQLRTIPERKVQLLEPLFPLNKAISELLVIRTIPYGRERISEGVAETYLLDRVFLPVKDSFER